MKKLLVSTSFILLAFVPFMLGNYTWTQDFGEHEKNSDDDLSKNKVSQLENYKAFEDAILLINDESTLVNYHDMHEVDLDNLSESKFASILTQRPNSEQTKILSQSFTFRDFAVLEFKAKIKSGEITFFDQIGNQAYQQKINGAKFELKRNDLNAGIYFYKISENGNAINSGKIIIQ